MLNLFWVSTFDPSILPLLTPTIPPKSNATETLSVSFALSKLKLISVVLILTLTFSIVPLFTPAKAPIFNPLGSSLLNLFANVTSRLMLLIFAPSLILANNPARVPNSEEWAVFLTVYLIVYLFVTKWSSPILDWRSPIKLPSNS